MKNSFKKFKKLLGFEENRWKKKDWFILLIHLWGISAIIMSFLFAFQKESFYDYSSPVWTSKIDNFYNIPFSLMILNLFFFPPLISWGLWKIEKNNVEKKLSWSKKLKKCFSFLGWLVWGMTVAGAWIAVSETFTKEGTIIALYGVVYQRIADKLEERYKSKKEKYEKEIIITLQQEIQDQEKKRVNILENEVSHSNQSYETIIEIPPTGNHLKTN